MATSTAAGRAAGSAAAGAVAAVTVAASGAVLASCGPLLISVISMVYDTQ